MGKALITSWANEGDQVLIGNFGAQLFALELAGTLTTDEEPELLIAHRCERDTLVALADASRGEPKSELQPS